MPYDGKILSRAMARCDEDKQRRARQIRERQPQRRSAGTPAGGATPRPPAPYSPTV